MCTLVLNNYQLITLTLKSDEVNRYNKINIALKCVLGKYSIQNVLQVLKIYKIKNKLE